MQHEQIGVDELANPVASRFQWLWIYPLLIALVELSIMVISPQAGLLACGALLVMLIIHHAFALRKADQQLSLALLLVPLIRTFSLALPLQYFPQKYWYGLIALPMLVACGLVFRHLHLPRRELGLRSGNLLLQGMIAMGGFGIGGVAYAMLQPAPLSGGLALSTLLLPVLVIACGSLTEELIFRGAIQVTAQRALGNWAMLYGALVFALLQLGYRSPAYVLLSFGTGLFFAYAVRLSGSMLGVVLAHCLASITLFFMMPALVASPLARLLPWAIGGGVLLALGTLGYLLGQRRLPALVVWSFHKLLGNQDVGPIDELALALRQFRLRSGLTFSELALHFRLPLRLLVEFEEGLRRLSPEQRERVVDGLRITTQDAWRFEDKREPGRRRNVG
ncbi:MAG: CPBP family intramembrane metalloprotease [Oscillochloris sp.]|nr:CPBP family intramembrane metalloprotease [Oscillochloris sp.]